MKKSQTKYIWIGAVLIAVVAILILLFGNFEFTHSFSLKIERPLAIGDVPTGCNIGGAGTTANEFICPGVCDVNGWSDCTTQTGEIPIVIFRTNAISKEDYNDRTKVTWIALNGLISNNKFTKTQELQLYCITSSAGGSRTSEIILDNNQAPPFNTRLYAWNSYLYAETGTGTVVMRQYKLCNDITDSNLLKIATSLQSIPAYATRERFGGSSNPFQCSKAWKIENGGVVKTSGTASYSSTTTGRYDTGIKRLSKNDKLTFPGNINYAVIDTSNACVRDICSDDKLGIIKCIKDANNCPIKDSKTTNCITGEFCTQLESTAVCEAPFEESVDVKSGFSFDEVINMKYGLKSARVTNALVTFTLRNTNNRQQAIEIVGPTNLNLPVTDKSITFTNPKLVGSYEIVVDKSYDGKSVSPTVYAFSVGNPLELSVKIPYSDLTGVKLIVGSQFYIDVGVSENGMLIPDLVTVTPKATLKLPDGTIKDVAVGQPVLKNDYLRYYFSVGEAGRFTFTAKASKFGVETKESETSAEVRLPQIDISYTNINQITNTKPGLKTIKFETRDAYGELFNTVITAKVVPSGASTGAGDIDVTSMVTSTETGKYEFQYSFPAGAYIIKVKATAPGYSGFVELPSASINIDETGQTKECGQSSDCPQGYTCNSSGQCVGNTPQWVYYLIISLAIIFAIIVVIVFANLLKKKNNVVIGGGL